MDIKCEYCHWFDLEEVNAGFPFMNFSINFENDASSSLLIRDNRLIFDDGGFDEDSQLKSEPIKFCPMCGRPLGGDS
ncbi:hypothetical protein [Lactobacillus sp. ESL0677]|uniref:hypothetical protein n=1 Tax=Lactobacillus sp. ESL0677 TaxID=2983208 RepID=UPI0023F63456|nr:hypothetical protein [Lactobacillus sp. ESL0677]WEV36230.1 hypothetical protein OZX76_05645 [Lactobacillus sp. ESL0677]